MIFLVVDFPEHLEFVGKLKIIFYHPKWIRTVGNNIGIYSNSSLSIDIEIQFQIQLCRQCGLTDFFVLSPAHLFGYANQFNISQTSSGRPL